MKRQSDNLSIQNAKKKGSFDYIAKSPLRTSLNRTHFRQQYFPKQSTQHTCVTTTQSSVKSPPNSKPISIANALQLLQETNPTSRKNSRRLHTNQLKNILAKEQEKISHNNNTRFNTHLQFQQPLIQHTSPKKSLKTSPDTKKVQEQLKNRISHKISGHAYDINAFFSDRQGFGNLKTKLRSNIQQRQFKFNNFTNTNQQFAEDVEYKFTKKKFPLPQNSDIVIKIYQDQLTTFEIEEIKPMEMIFYLRPSNLNLELDEEQQNFGFDNQNGDYRFIPHDQVCYRYELLEQLGHGSFGQVFKVFDHKHQQEVALKIIKNQEKFSKQALTEIEILKTVSKADSSCCLIKMLNCFSFRNHICMVFELLSCNLYEFLTLNDFQGFELDLVRRFAIQILQALLYLQECKIIHCDLKPENILLKDVSRSGIKVIDFGSSCFSNTKLYTYIQSRFYRAPEILLGIPYSNKIDMWSFGCIMAELYLGNSLFQSKSERELIYIQTKVIGMPNEKFIDNCPKKARYFNQNYELLFKIKESELLVELKPLRELFCQSPAPFFDFVKKCLQWDPNLRLSPGEALIHPWIVEGLPDEIRMLHLSQMKEFLQQKDQGQGKQQD